jgi:endoglucanase
MFRYLAPSLVSLLLLAGLTGCDTGDSSNPTSAGVAGPTALRGCVVDGGPAPITAPGGYYTSGSTVCTADGTPHMFHGVDRPSLEWDPAGEWGGREGIPASDFNAMAAWHANVVRIALNQDFWLSGAALYSPGYQQTVDDAVKAAEAAGMDVILDLHWSDRGDLTVPVSGKTQNKAGNSDQQQMADVNSLTFWAQVAGKYKGDGHVLLELYNEPNGISWSIWLNGGMFSGFQAVGMQDLYKAVRDAGADNVVIAGGLSWSFDDSGVGASPIQGYNIMYAAHTYSGQHAASQWPSSFGYLATRDIAPVIVTEFGDGKTCVGDWDTQLIQFAASNNLSWTAWAWYPGGCSFPSLLSDWSYTPTAQGQVVKDALLAYPAPTLVTDAGADASTDAGIDASGESGDGAAGSAGSSAQ